MMASPQAFINSIKDKSYEELVRTRDDLIESIQSYEKMKSEVGAIIYDHDPSPETQYGMHLEYLAAVCKLMTEKSPQDSIEYICSEIRNTVTGLWENEIKEDYLNGHLLREDTLKNSMYYHIRRKLGPLFNRNNIRIFTEYYMDDAAQKADIVIVRTEPWYQPKADKDLIDSVTDVLAVFELKYKAFSNDTVNAIKADKEKLKGYIKKYSSKYPNCKYYYVIVFEGSDDENNIFWLGSDDYSWAEHKVIELAAGEIDEKMVFKANRDVHFS